MKATPITDPAELAALCQRKWREDHPTWQRFGDVVWVDTEQLRVWRAKQLGKDCEHDFTRR